MLIYFSISDREYNKGTIFLISNGSNYFQLKCISICQFVGCISKANLTRKLSAYVTIYSQQNKEKRKKFVGRSKIENQRIEQKLPCHQN